MGSPSESRVFIFFTTFLMFLFFLFQPFGFEILRCYSALSRAFFLQKLFDLIRCGHQTACGIQIWNWNFSTVVLPCAEIDGVEADPREISEWPLAITATCLNNLSPSPSPSRWSKLPFSWIHSSQLRWFPSFCHNSHLTFCVFEWSIHSNPSAIPHIPFDSANRMN